MAKKRAKKNGKRNGKGNGVQVKRDQFGKWLPGASASPGGKGKGPDLAALLRKELQNDVSVVLVDSNGKEVRKTMPGLEVFVHKLRKWAFQEDTTSKNVPRQLLCIKLIMERMYPATQRHAVAAIHLAPQGQALTDAAKAFQVGLAKLASDDPNFDVSMLKRMRNQIEITDADLGIDGNGENGDGNGK